MQRRKGSKVDSIACGHLTAGEQGVGTHDRRSHCFSDIIYPEGRQRRGYALQTGVA